uniref:SCP domain-containing protein n=1 Tax=Timema shepardi TaxID=629360 RepID=A0A7R9FVQ6_TIMSH|nr:unnamed protein product [Timema shepardi]
MKRGIRLDGRVGECPAEKCKTPFSRGFNQTEKNAIVNEHNRLRNISWNEELATVAQRWADQCKVGHDANRNTQWVHFLKRRCCASLFSRPLYLSSALTQAAPPTPSTAWSGLGGSHQAPHRVVSPHNFAKRDNPSLFANHTPTSHRDSRCRDYVLPPTVTHVAMTLSYLPPQYTLPGRYPTSHCDSRCWDAILPPIVTHVAGTLSYLSPQLTLPGLHPTSHRDSRCRDSILPPTTSHFAGMLPCLPPRLTLPELYPTSHRDSRC